MRTISRGIPGTAMPAFGAVLTDEEKRAVVRFVETLAVGEEEGRGESLFELRGAGKPISVPPPPSMTPELVARGKQLYVDAGCGTCHGVSGKGDGPGAAALRDAWGRPIRPADFTRGVFKGGGDPGSLYLRIAAGMDGTPMPAYGEDVLSPAQRWALVAYIRSLARGASASGTQQAGGGRAR